MQLSAPILELLGIAALLLVLLLARSGARRRLGAAFRGLARAFLIIGLIAGVFVATLLLARSVAPHGPVPGPGSGAGRPPAGGGYTGTLSVSDDNGFLLVNGGYIGQGRAVITLPVGSYTLTAISPSTGRKCWETTIRIDGGRTTTVRYSTYCQ